MDYTKSEKKRVLARASSCAESAKATGTIVSSTDLDGGFEVMAAQLKTGWFSSKWVLEVSGKGRPSVHAEGPCLYAAMNQLDQKLEPVVPVTELVGELREKARLNDTEEFLVVRNGGNTAMLTRCSEKLWKAVVVLKEGDVRFAEGTRPSAVMELIHRMSENW